MRTRTLWIVLLMSAVALLGNALVSGCLPHQAAPEAVSVEAPAAQPAQPPEPLPFAVAAAKMPPQSPVRVAAPLPAPNPAPVVAIVFRELQETDDKAADEAANAQAIIEMVAEAIELTGGLADIVPAGKTVLLKPNLTNHRGGRYFPSMTTDVRVMAGVVEALKAHGDNKLIIAEGSGPPAFEMYPICGYDKLAEKHGIELVEMNTPDKFVTMQISREVFQAKPLPPAMPVSTGTHAIAQHPVAGAYMDADIVINVPCLKTHCLTGITVAMKNLYGLYPGTRQPWHDDVEANLADLARLRPTALVVVDGIVAMQGDGPLWGTPVKMNLIIAGRDMVAVDTVSAAVMGFDPKRVQHVQYAALQGLGVADLDKIVVVGTPIEQIKKTFADGHWSFALKCPKTDANIARLLKQQNSHPMGGWRGEERGKVVGWQTYWPAEDLPIDREKYPDVLNRGFGAAFNKWDDYIHFNVNYRALHREDIQPLKETMQAWIDANMETDMPTSMPTTFPGLSDDVKAFTEAWREQQKREREQQQQKQ
ncbi:MAG: DUF362 domain-containing protein [Phycisphaerae bacterium]|nr:DUF362 domain-containing protein [Phycisphaerae bacterium]